MDCYHHMETVSLYEGNNTRTCDECDSFESMLLVLLTVKIRSSSHLQLAAFTVSHLCRIITGSFFHFYFQNLESYSWSATRGGILLSVRLAFAAIPRPWLSSPTTIQKNVPASMTVRYWGFLSFFAAIWKSLGRSFTPCAPFGS